MACILVDALPVQVEWRRLGAHASLIITHPVEADAVFAATDDVLDAGVRIGMALSAARHTAPHAQVVAPDELAYYTAHAAIQAALGQFSPVIETVALGEFLLDPRGLEPHFASEQALAAALTEAARSASDLAVRVGLAAGKFTAQQAARAAFQDQPIVVPAGEEARFLAALPVDVLPGLPGELRRRLYLLDLATLGDLTALKKPAVLRQFGPELSSLYELARGNDPRPINPDVPPLRLVRSMNLAGAALGPSAAACGGGQGVADRRGLLNVAQRLCWQIGKALTARGFHAEALKLTLYAEDGGMLEAGQAVKPPTCDEARLSRMAGALLGKLTLTAPVVTVAVSVYPLRPWHLNVHQLTLAAAGVPAKQTKLETALQLVAHRFGQLAVRVAALLGPPVPVPIAVIVGDSGQPAYLDYGGRTRTVLAIDEHWRQEERWWDQPIQRDYFRVVLSNGEYRNIFQDRLTEAWYLDRAWPLL